MAAIRELPYTPAPQPLLGPTPSRTRPAPPVTAPVDAGTSPFARLVRGFAAEAERGEATVSHVVGAGRVGVPLDATSLLALQAGIYRYGETMDLAAQLVDKAQTGVKTVVQGQ